jgi:hypothetical protein
MNAKNVSPAFFALAGALSIVWLMGCGGDEMAGSTRTGNARIAGAAYIDDEPVVGASVKLRNADFIERQEGSSGNSVKRDTVTDNNGVFIFENIPYGDYTIEISDSMGYGFTLTKTIASESQNAHVDLGGCFLKPCGSLGIGIRTENIDPSIDIYANIYGLDRRLKARADGAIRFIDLPPGAYRISITTSAPDSTGSLEFETEIKSGEWTWENWSLPVDYWIDSVAVVNYLRKQNVEAEPWNQLVGSRYNRIWSLALCNRGLQSLNPSIAALNFIGKLDLSGNPLQSLPDTMITMTNITELVLDSANVQALWPRVLEYTHLRRLHCRDNGLTALPHNFDTLSNLERLYLSDNLFDRFPED